MSWPIPLPTWVWTWMRWYLGRSEFKPFGPRNPAVRPNDAPTRIPQWAWDRLKALVKASPPPSPPVPTLGLFAKNTAFLRNPRGGIENTDDQFNAGLRLALLNIGDHDTSEWSAYELRARNQGIVTGYWRHCLTEAHIVALLDASFRNAKPCVCINVEFELVTTLPPWRIRQIVDAHRYQGQVSTILLGWQGWVENGIHKGPDYTPIGDWPSLLEIFPQDAPALWPPNVKVHECIEHGRILGMKLPVPVYGTYTDKARGPAQPSWYDRSLHHGLYTADDVSASGDWAVWKWPR